MLFPCHWEVFTSVQPFDAPVAWRGRRRYVTIEVPGLFLPRRRISLLLEHAYRVYRRFSVWADSAIPKLPPVVAEEGPEPSHNVCEAQDDISVGIPGTVDSKCVVLSTADILELHPIRVARIYSRCLEGASIIFVGDQVREKKEVIAEIAPITAANDLTSM